MRRTSLPPAVSVAAILLGVLAVAPAPIAMAQAHQSWEWDADVDPFLQDDNGDGLFDFKERNNHPFVTGELITVGGRDVWQHSGGFDVVVDTNPKGLVGDALATVIARATGPSEPTAGVVWWLNFDQTKPVGEDDGMAAVNVRISLDEGDNTQRVTWFQNDHPNYGVQLDQVLGLPTDFLRIDIEYDTADDEITYDVLDAASGLSLLGSPRTFGYGLTTVNADEFATILVWPGGESAGQVDYISLEADLFTLEPIPEPSTLALAALGLAALILFARRTGRCRVVAG